MSGNDSLEGRIGYRFKKPEFLKRALIHASAQGAGGVTQDDVAYAQRLSWLGDSVLEMIVSDKLYRDFPRATNEDLHNWSIRLTEDRTLARVAKELGLESSMVIGESLRLDPGALDRHVMLADALEAVLAAIYVDGGLQSAQGVVQKIFAGDFLSLLKFVHPSEK